MSCLLCKQLTLGSLLRLSKAEKNIGWPGSSTQQPGTSTYFHSSQQTQYYHCVCHFWYMDQAGIWQRWKWNKGSCCCNRALGNENLHPAGWKILSLQRDRRRLCPSYKNTNWGHEMVWWPSYSTTFSTSGCPKWLLHEWPDLRVSTNVNCQQPHCHSFLLSPPVWRIHSPLFYQESWWLGLLSI